jgi:hypothetical protein
MSPIRTAIRFVLVAIATAGALTALNSTPANAWIYDKDTSSEHLIFLLHPDEVDQGALNLVPGTNKSGSKLLCEGFIAKANAEGKTWLGSSSSWCPDVTDQCMKAAKDLDSWVKLHYERDDSVPFFKMRLTCIRTSDPAMT